MMAKLAKQKLSFIGHSRKSYGSILCDAGSTLDSCYPLTSSLQLQDARPYQADQGSGGPRPHRVPRPQHRDEEAGRQYL